MPDRYAPISIIQNSFATGEIAPSLYGRTDLQKYHSGCAVLRNFYVDYKGGVTTRPGSQYVGTFGSSGYGRLYPFQFSPSIGQTYILAFSNLKLRFIKNPGTPSYPNSSNAGLVQSSGSPYELAIPYTTDVLPDLNFLQIADVLWITCRGFNRKKLSRISDTNWTLTDVSNTPAIAAPTISSVTISANPAGSTDPSESRYMYVVSAVNENGDESLPSIPYVSTNGINIAATQGTVTIFWTAVADAAFYKVYKALPAHGNKVPMPHEQFGFAGFSYGTLFTDSNIVADFANPPIQAGDPFASAPLSGYTITNPGATYPVGGTTISVTDGTGSGAVVYPILDTNTAGATGGIIGLFIANPGSGYSAPTVSASGGGGSGFAATLSVGPSSGITPAVVSLVQQRLTYASTSNKPNTVFGGRPGHLDDFRKSNPVVDNDAFEFSIFDQQVTSVVWLKAMPGGLLVGTDAGVVQLTGGSSTASNPAAITPTNAVIVPQSSYGASAVPPIVVDSNLLYVQVEGSVIRDMQYNYFVNTYASVDTTILSSHLFQGKVITEWAYQDTPTKVIWGRMSGGTEISLTYLRSQEVMGFARHDTNGSIESIAVVQEGMEDAVYRSVLRNGARCIERQAGQTFYQKSDAWQLDSALSIVSNYPAANLTLATPSGNNVLVTADAAIFGAGVIGQVINSIGSRAVVTSFVDATHVRVNITQSFGSFPDSLTPYGLPATTWRLDPNVSSVSGLNHLEGMTVYALVDGEPQGPFTVTGGVVNLTTPGSQVVVGLKFTCQLQPLYVDIGGEETTQGKRKKVAAASIRVRNAAGLKYGTSFNELREWNQGTSSTDPALALPYGAYGLFEGDQRIIVNQTFNVGGWVCVQQDQPLPATILAIIPELAQGDTR